MVKFKVTGMGDDLKQAASLLVSENISFQYDGENEIVANSHLTHNGFDMTEKLNEYLPRVKAVKIEPRIPKKKI